MGALLVLVLAAHYRVAFLGETYVARDAVLVTLPSRAHLGAALAELRIPEWWDAVAVGAPFAASPINGAFYPPFWLGALLRADLATDLAVLLHLLVAALGTALLARRLGAGRGGATLAGGIFVTCGYVASMPANNNAHLLCWIPWVGWAADRAAACASSRSSEAVLAIALLAAAFAAQLTVAEPTYLTIALVIALALTLLRARARLPALGRAAVAGLAALALAAAAWVPAAALMGETARDAGYTTLERSAWSFAAIRALEWLWPGMLGSQVGPDGLARNLARALDPVVLNGWKMSTWAFSVYVGIPAFTLVVVAARRGAAERWLLATSAVFVLLALGPATPALSAASAVVPWMQLARYPEKYLAGAALLWSLLAGLGYARLRRGPADRAVVLVAGGAAAALALAIAVAWLSRAALAELVTARAARDGFPIDAARGLHGAMASGAIAVGVALGWAGLQHAAARRPILAGAAAALLLGDLVVRGWAVNPTAPRPRVVEPPRLLQRIQAPPRPAVPPRLWTDFARSPTLEDYATSAAFADYVVQGVMGNVPALHGIGAFPGHDPLGSRALDAFRRLEGALDPGTYAALVGAELAVVPIPEASPRTLVSADAAAQAAIVRVEGARPRAFVAPRWVRGERPPDVIRSDAGVDRGRIVLPGPGDARTLAAAGEPPGPCSVTSPRPERVELRCDSRAGGYATLLDAWARGWSATLDGRPAPVEAADGVFRAVRVPPGPHAIAFEYAAPGLRAGIGVAAAAWAVWVAVVVLAARRRRADRPREA